MEKNLSPFREIPKVFYSFNKQGLFTHCMECERDLLIGDCDYLIEKAVRNYKGFEAEDVLYDYAICMDCLSELQQRMSKESMESIEKFVARYQVHKRIAPQNLDLSDLEPFYSRCMFTDTHKADCSEYHLSAYCTGDQLNLKILPYMVSDSILDQLSELISDETRDELDGFFNKHHSPTPGMQGPDPRLILF